MGERMEKALNEQVNAELFSAYLYLSMSAYLESVDLPGAASWMHMQAKEEVIHAMKLFDYIHSVGGRVALEAVDKPQYEWSSITEVFEAALGHEKKVTAMINNLVDIALEEKDHAANQMLQWFVAEQVEEEESATEVLRQLKMVGDGHGLFMVDRELGTRMPPAEAPADGE